MRKPRFCQTKLCLFFRLFGSYCMIDRFICLFLQFQDSGIFTLWWEVISKIIKHLLLIEAPKAKNAGNNSFPFLSVGAADNLTEDDNYYDYWTDTDFNYTLPTINETFPFLSPWEDDDTTTLYTGSLTLFQCKFSVSEHSGCFDQLTLLYLNNLNFICWGWPQSAKFYSLKPQIKQETFASLGHTLAALSLS